MEKDSEVCVYGGGQGTVLYISTAWHIKITKVTQYYTFLCCSVQKIMHKISGFIEFMQALVLADSTILYSVYLLNSPFRLPPVRD